MGVVVLIDLVWCCFVVFVFVWYVAFDTCVMFGLLCVLDVLTD